MPGARLIYIQDLAVIVLPGFLLFALNRGA